MAEKTRERIVVDQAYQLDYTTLTDIAKRCGGWMRSSGGAEGESAEAWVDDKAYVFSGRGLVDFLYAVKDNQNETLYAVKDLLDYIEKSAKQPASVFVRDAIVARAAEVKAKIEGGARSV
jgi:hypothetical protein